MPLPVVPNLGMIIPIMGKKNPSPNRDRGGDAALEFLRVMGVEIAPAGLPVDDIQFDEVDAERTG